MPGGEELATLGGRPVQPALRHEPVEEHDHGVGEGEPVGPGPYRQRSGAEDRDGEGSGEQHVLPCGDDVERGAAKAHVPQLRHHEVVDGEPDDEHGERDARQPLAHVIATSVRPRLTIRTGPGNSPRRSPLPSRWFSRAQPLPVRSYARPAARSGSQWTSGSLV